MNATYLLIPAVLSMTGCVDAPHGPTQYSSESVDLDDAEAVRVDLKMGAGELRVTDGAVKLARADFAYNVASWKPEVRYARAGNRGVLVIAQPGSHTTLGNFKYSWDLQLNKKVPIEFRGGTGEARSQRAQSPRAGIEYGCRAVGCRFARQACAELQRLDSRRDW
ncbi:MAG: toast rack family protein [Candidatus Solibacter sp.]